ncbi:MAG TPA: NADP-dependent malic enzyme [Alphaproteobacteria bacterium]|nr:NADP-dependent malic enzyme [Alphaproteobacteria bacterium]
MANDIAQKLEEDALNFHSRGQPGKISLAPTKPLTTQRDLTLAYSPGVAWPCLHIAKNPDLAYDYTAKGNVVAVISNGTAVLGLGDIGALAAKPVMEGKCCLFKRFADVDAFDIEVDTKDVDAFVNCVRYIGKAFGGINLEDIKAPECFIIEQRLRELLDIPVFHDDQHGTSIVATAGLLNALHLTGRDIKKIKMVVNGAGAASIACVELLKRMGLPGDQVILCDTKGVIYQGRTESMNQWKSAHAAPTKARTLAQALEGADVLFGLSAKGAVTKPMVKSMANKPIIFAMANPDPEITPEEVREVRSDAIIATGRSDYPNQVNNVLGFPYIFRGALDVRASTINDEMKIAAAQALAALAREDVPDEMDAAYSGKRLRYGPEYIIPAPFDPRLISIVPQAVARAAMESGVARSKITDMAAYGRKLMTRRDPIAAILALILEKVRANPRRVVFAEGEEEKVVRAAVLFRESGYGTPVLIGREERIHNMIATMGIGRATGLEIHNARLSTNNRRYADFLYRRLQRQGFLWRDCQRMINQDRNVFAAAMVACGDADAMVTGVTRSYHVALDDVRKAIDPAPGQRLIGVSILIVRGRAVFVADTTVTELPSPRDMAETGIAVAGLARRMGYEPRVAMLSFSTFGNPASQALPVREAVVELDRMKASGHHSIDFEYDGEMSAEVALDAELMRTAYPFCRLSDAANVLVMPGLHSANITSQVVEQLGGGTVIGPLLVGLAKPVQIVPLGSTVGDLVNTAALAAYDSLPPKR